MVSVPEIQKHPFFEGTDWNAISNQTFKSPYNLCLINNRDLSYFDYIDDGKPMENPAEDIVSDWTKDF